MQFVVDKWGQAVKRLGPEFDYNSLEMVRPCCLAMTLLLLLLLLRPSPARAAAASAAAAS
jgi:hypothetical protein